MFSAPNSLNRQSSNRLFAYGCGSILFVSAALLYCVGALSFLVRPLLVERAAPTAFDQSAIPTARPSPTFISLPTAGTLLATPTQAPIPTREPPTITPTLDPNATVLPTLTGTPRANSSPTNRASATPTRRASPTATPR